jgi:phage FluMu protein Com
MKNQAELTWFLTSGETAFERSPMGHMLWKAEVEAYVSDKCKFCDNGIVTEKTIARYAAKPKLMGSAQLGDWCPRCKGSGTIPVRMTAEEQREFESGDFTRADQGGQREQVDDTVLIHYAHVSRTLKKMPPAYAAALLAAYGNDGARLEAEASGRAWAVVPLTTSGLKILERERERKHPRKNIDPYDNKVECLVQLFRLSRNDKKVQAELGELLADGLDNATTLLHSAEECWDDITSEKDADKPKGIAKNYQGKLDIQGATVRRKTRTKDAN